MTGSGGVAPIETINWPCVGMSMQCNKTTRGFGQDPHMVPHSVGEMFGPWQPTREPLSSRVEGVFCNVSSVGKIINLVNLR